MCFEVSLSETGYTIESDLADLGLIFAVFGAEKVLKSLKFLKGLEKSEIFKNCCKNKDILKEF